MCKQQSTGMAPYGWDTQELETKPVSDFIGTPKTPDSKYVSQDYTHIIAALELLGPWPALYQSPRAADF